MISNALNLISESHYQHSVHALGAVNSGISGEHLFKLSLTKCFLVAGFFTTLSVSRQYTVAWYSD
jgi:hypothetical protein